MTWRHRSRSPWRTGSAGRSMPASRNCSEECGNTGCRWRTLAMDDKPSRTSRTLLRCLRLLAALCIGAASLGTVQAQDAAALKTRHAALQDKLANNQFGRPLYLESAQTSGDLKGDIYSVVEYPFSTVEQAIKPAAQ